MAKTYLERVLDLLGSHFYDSDEHAAIEALSEALKDEPEATQKHFLRKFLLQAKTAWDADLKDARQFADEDWAIEAQRRVTEVNKLLKE